MQYFVKDEAGEWVPIAVEDLVHLQYFRSIDSFGTIIESYWNKPEE